MRPESKMIRSKGANYIGVTEKPRVRSLKTKITAAVALAAAVLTVFAGVGAAALVLDSGTTKHVTAANAGLGLSCTSVIGGDMDKRSPWGSGPLSARLFENLPGRTFMLSELIGSPAWTNYTGIGDGFETDSFVKKYKDVIGPLGLNGGALDDGTGTGSSATTAGTLPQTYATNWAAVSTKLKAERNTGTCFFKQTFVTNVANGAGLGLANAMQMFVGWVSTTAFNASFICDANTPSSDCIDLVKIIGGRNDGSYQAGGDGGIIGNLTNSIYKPLVLIVVVITALGVAWTGIVKRKFREAITQTAWLLFSFIIGLALLLNPSMLAKAPMIATNAVTGCVIGAFNGTNCFDGSSFTSKTAPSNLSASSGVCISDAAGASADQITALAVNSMGCTIWKTFILQNYAKGAFGVNLDQLEVSSPGTVAGAAVAKAGIAPDKFCYSLQSTGSIKDYDGQWLQTKTGGSKICNLAVYNILMQMKVTPAGATASDVPTQYDPAWYNLIVTTASSDKMWPIWTNGGQQFMQGGVAVISVLLGGVLIVVSSVAALMYYITAIILLIFAPLFILVGINPGRGKKIMMGWVETIIASILKYLASAIFLLVSLTLYSTVLGAADPLAALLFVGILSVVLWMYRGDLVEMFGKVSLGGERLASVMEKQIPIMGATANQLKTKAGQMPSAVIGGALGGMMAGGIGKAGEGMRIATQNELRSAPGLVGRAAQAKERQMRDNKADFGSDATRAKESAKRAEQISDGLDQEVRAADNQVNQAASNAETANEAYERANEDLHQGSEDRVDAANTERVTLDEFDATDLRAAHHQDTVDNVANSASANGAISPAFAEFKKLQMSIDQLGANARIAELGGDVALATTFRSEQQVELSRRRELESNGTATPEGRAAWSNQGQEFDRLLKLEQMEHPELMDASGSKVIAYDANEHVASAQRADDAKKMSMAADIKISIATTAVEDAKATAVRADEVLGERSSEAIVIKAKAREAKINSEALNANADTLREQYVDLGPGKLPTVQSIKNMKNEAFADSEKVRDAYTAIDNITSDEETEAPTKTVRDTIAGGARQLNSVASTGKTIDARAEALVESQAANAQKLSEAQESRQAAADTKERTRLEATMAEREANKVKMDYTQKLADSNEAARLANEQANSIRDGQKKVATLDRAIADGKTVRGASGEMLSSEDSAKYLESIKKEFQAGIDQTAKESVDAVARADVAKQAATEALNAVTKAEENLKNAKVNSSNANKNEADAGRSESDAINQQKANIKEADRLADIRKKEAGVLTADQAQLTKNPQTANERTRNESLNKLIKMADELSKATPVNVDSTTASQVAGLQAQIANLAKNVDRMPQANQGLISALSEAIAKVGVDKKPGLPKAPGGSPRFEEGE